MKFIWTATTAAKHFGLTKRHFIRKIEPLHIPPSRIETNHYSIAELYIFGPREMKRIKKFFRSLAAVVLLSAFMPAALAQYPYETLERLSVGVNLVAHPNISIGRTTFKTCMSQQIALQNAKWSGDLWVEPWPSTSYGVKVWYADGSTDAVMVGDVSSPAGLSAINLGVTGEDYIGTDAELKPNGTPDQHFRLDGLKEVPVKVQILGYDPSGLWEFPWNGTNYSIYSEYHAPLSATGYCDGRAQYEMIKDCVTRHNSFWNEQNSGKIRSQNTLNNRLAFYKLEFVNVMDDFTK